MTRSRTAGARRPALAVFWLAAAACLFAALEAHGQVRQWPSQSPPRPLAARDLKFPPYQTRVLANGLQVIVVMHTEQPAVSLRMLVKAGTIHDPKGRPGVAALAASLLDQGTSSRTAEQLADAIDSMGGAIESGVGRDLTFADMVVMKDDVATAMALLADIVRRPAFAGAEIERQRQQVLAGLKVGHDDPEYVANVVFDRLVYGFSPYGYPGNGTAESVAAITRDDLVTYHSRWFVPNNALLAVVGDIGSDEAFAAVEKAFGDWPRKDLPPEEAVEPPPMTRRVIVIDKPDAVQTEIRVGHVGLLRKHKSYLALDMAVRILGGEGANRLHRVLRTERGLTYGASADIEALKRSGQIAVSTATRSEATGEVLRLIADEFSTIAPRARLRRRTGRRQGVRRGTLSADARDPQRHRDPCPRPPVLRTAALRPRDLPATRRRDRRPRRGVGCVGFHQARPVVGRSRRKRGGVREGAGWSRFRAVRTHSDRRARSAGGRLPEEVRARLEQREPAPVDSHLVR